jgi:hypothetical protein
VEDRWTKFLEKSDPHTISNGFPEDLNPLLAQIYEVSQMEEYYYNNGVGGKLIKHRMILRSIANQLTGANADSWTVSASYE